MLGDAVRLSAWPGVVFDQRLAGFHVERKNRPIDADTSRKLLYEVIASGFDFHWDPGSYRVRAFRDLDRNKAWKRESEPASEEMRIVLTPGGELVGIVFVLTRPTPGAPPAPGSGP